MNARTDELEALVGENIITKTAITGTMDGVAELYSRIISAERGSADAMIQAHISSMEQCEQEKFQIWREKLNKLIPFGNNGYPE